MKNKKIIVIVLLIIVLALGICAGLYYCTDVFKSDKDKFFKYFSQNKEIGEIFEDELLTKYVEKQKENPFENNGELKITSNIGSESIDEMLKNINVKYSGKTDMKNKKYQEDISLNYSEDQIPFTVVKNDEKYGIKADWTNNKYIAIENNNLKDLASKLGVENVDQIPDKINFDNLKEEVFTEEEIKNIKKTYGDILTKEFENSDFTNIKENNQEAYKLSVTDTKLIKIYTNLLETLKNDNVILEKITKYSNEKYTVEEVQKEIDSMLEKVKDVETENKEVMTITVYKEKGKLTKTEINLNAEQESLKMTIIKNDDNAKIEMIIPEGEKENSITLDLAKVKDGSNLNYNIEFNVKSDNNIVKIKGNVKYSNIKELKDVNVECTFGIEGTINEENISLELNVTNNSKFVNSVDVESLDGSSLLNDISQDDIENLFKEVMSNLQKVLSETNIMKSLSNSTSDLENLTEEGSEIYNEDQDYVIEENKSEDEEETNENSQSEEDSDEENEDVQEDEE